MGQTVKCFSLIIRKGEKERDRCMLFMMHEAVCSWRDLVGDLSFVFCTYEAIKKGRERGKGKDCIPNICCQSFVDHHG